jgi:hypothetical protein
MMPVPHALLQTLATLQPVSFRTKLGADGTYTQPSFATSTSLPEANANAAFNGNVMGFDRRTQTHVMRMVMNQNLVEDANGQGIVPRTGNQRLEVVVVAQLIFRVDYEGKCQCIPGTFWFRNWRTWCRTWQRPRDGFPL